MADPFTGLLVVAGGAQVGKAAMQFSAADAKEEALDLEREQRELQYQQKTLANYDLTNKIMDRQLAQASERGVGLGSPSLQAIQGKTLSVSGKQRENLETEEDIFERNVRLESENVQNTLAAELLQDVGDFASSAYKAGKAGGSL